MKEIIIHEVGLRDGLQMESESVPTITKEQWVDEMIKASVDVIQLGSFVNLQKLPQMADTDDLFLEFTKPGRKPPEVVLSGLVLNEKGLERGMACGVEMFCMGVSASETHSRKNTGMSVEEATGRIINMAKEALSTGKVVQASVQSAFGCGFEGAVPEDRVYVLIKKFFDAGIKMVSLADTAGHGNPQKVERMFSVIKEINPEAELACHFHNTYGMGLANCLIALKLGVKYFESAFGGLGGCPFTKLPAGNVCTEDLVHMLQQMGMRRDIDLKRLIGIAKYAGGFFVRDLPGFVYKAGTLNY